METTVQLTYRQQSILLALLRQMVAQREINLMAAIVAERSAQPTALDSLRQFSESVIRNINERVLEGNPVRAITLAAQRILEDEVIQGHIYLSRQFKGVQTSDLFFPGVSVASNEDSEEEVKDAEPSEVGALEQEFPDEASRYALLAALHDWARRDPAWGMKSDDTIGRVCHVFGMSISFD